MHVSVHRKQEYARVKFETQIDKGNKKSPRVENPSVPISLLQFEFAVR